MADGAAGREEPRDAAGRGLQAPHSSGRRSSEPAPKQRALAVEGEAAEEAELQRPRRPGNFLPLEEAPAAGGAGASRQSEAEASDPGLAQPPSYPWAPEGARGRFAPRKRDFRGHNALARARGGPAPEEAAATEEQMEEALFRSQLQLVVSKAVKKGITSGLQLLGFPPRERPLHRRRRAPSRSPEGWQGPPRATAQDTGARSGEGEAAALSEEEEEEERALPEASALAGLPQPEVFAPNEQEAKELGSPPTEAQRGGGPGPDLSPQPATGRETIPAVKLFVDVVQSQWDKPAVGLLPMESDKELYNVESDLSDLLCTPTVDVPAAALASAGPPPTNAIEALKWDDRRGDLALRRAHEAAAWAVKAAISASFFNRASLVWLDEMQARIPPGDVRLHQDVNNLVAAVKYSADATLNAAKFASRSMAASVAARRLLWLRHWQVDKKNKRKLVSAPFTGHKLFGEALEPLPAGSRDKASPPSLSRKDCHLSPYFQSHPPTTQNSDVDYDQSQGPSPDGQADRSDSRSLQQSQGPPQGDGGHPSHPK